MRFRGCSNVLTVLLQRGHAGANCRDLRDLVDVSELQVNHKTYLSLDALVVTGRVQGNHTAAPVAR